MKNILQIFEIFIQYLKKSEMPTLNTIFYFEYLTKQGLKSNIPHDEILSLLESLFLFLSIGSSSGPEGHTNNIPATLDPNTQLAYMVNSRKFINEFHNSNQEARLESLIQYELLLEFEFRASQFSDTVRSFLEVSVDI
jgi:hypothetical protein